MSDLKREIKKRLIELREDCALQRLHLRNAFGRRWSGCERRDPDNPSSWDLHWENLQSEAQRQRPKDVEAADKRLAEFISESRTIMGADWPGSDHGRLCWSPFCGRLPIGQFYCQLEEGHAGPHRGTEEYGRETEWPNSPLQEVTNEHEWHKLIQLCKHETTVLHEGILHCSICGHQMSEAHGQNAVSTTLAAKT